MSIQNSEMRGSIPTLVNQAVAKGLDHIKITGKNGGSITVFLGKLPNPIPSEIMDNIQKVCDTAQVMLTGTEKVLPVKELNIYLETGHVSLIDIDNFSVQLQRTDLSKISDKVKNLRSNITTLKNQINISLTPKEILTKREIQRKLDQLTKALTETLPRAYDPTTPNSYQDDRKEFDENLILEYKNGDFSAVVKWNNSVDVTNTDQMQAFKKAWLLSKDNSSVRSMLMKLPLAKLLGGAEKEINAKFPEAKPVEVPKTASSGLPNIGKAPPPVRKNPSVRVLEPTACTNETCVGWESAKIKEMKCVRQAGGNVKVLANVKIADKTGKMVYKTVSLDLKTTGSLKNINIEKMVRQAAAWAMVETDKPVRLPADIPGIDKDQGWHGATVLELKDKLEAKNQIAVWKQGVGKSLTKKEIQLENLQAVLTDFKSKKYETHKIRYEDGFFVIKTRKRELEKKTSGNVPFNWTNKGLSAIEKALKLAKGNPALEKDINTYMKVDRYSIQPEAMEDSPLAKLKGAPKGLNRDPLQGGRVSFSDSFSGSISRSDSISHAQQTKGPWELHLDDKGQTYYWNSVTNEAVWEPPPEFLE